MSEADQVGRFEYECRTPECEGTMRGDFGDDVTCPVCGTTWETEWDYTDAMEGSMAWWITGPKERESGPERRRGG